MALKDKWTKMGRAVKNTRSQMTVVHLTQEEKAVGKMNEVNAFFTAHGREPTMDRSNLREYELSIKLQDLRHHKQKFPSLIELDSYQLLDSKSLSPFCKEQLTQREKEQLHGINPE